MAKVFMNDMIVLLPGIMGSVLEKDGKELWGLSFRSIWNALPSPNDRLQQLMLQGDDQFVDDIGDGVVVTQLMPDAHLIPFFWKIDGYSAVSEMIKNYFEVIPGSSHDETPANYFEFPYDWRRDNRYNARVLKKFVDHKIGLWRQRRSQAKVIFLAHSMGGIIARYYLEALEGWPDCRALITFGTPYRGSVKVLDYLANGYQNIAVDLSEVVRSFTSSYQLLPRYPVVEYKGTYKRVAELDDIPNVDKSRAEEALAFHQEIDEAVERRQITGTYSTGYKTIPIVGTKQPGLQAASLTNGILSVRNTVPSIFSALLGASPEISTLLEDSDGTVPRVSATPIELGDEYRDTFYPELHGSLQNNRQILADLFERLKQMQIPNLGAIRGPEVDTTKENKAALSVFVKDIYLKQENVAVSVKLINVSGPTEDIKMDVESKTINAKTFNYRFNMTGTDDVFELKGLPPDLYHIKISTINSGPQSPPPVHDIFEVLEY